VRPRFVGRDTELRHLRVAAEQARCGKQAVVLVVGPAGMGKTALVRHFVAEQSDFRLMRGVGDPAETSLPFGVLEQLLADAGAGCHANGASPPDALVAGSWLLAALGEAQASGPLLLWLDDAHWADGASLVAATFALRRLRHDRVLAVVGVRTGEERRLPEGLRHLVEESAIRLPLAGLDGPEVAELAMELGWGRLPPSAARRLREQTEGNPLYVRALLAEALANQVTAHGQLFAAAQHPPTAACADPAAQHRHRQDAAELLLLGPDVAAAAALLPEIEAAPPDPRRQLVLGHHAFLAGELEPARRLLADAAADPRASPEVAAAAGAHLAWLAVLAGDGAGAVSWAQRALSAAPSTSPVAGLASGLAAAGMGIAGRARDGLALLAAAARQRPPTPDETTVRGILRLWTDDLAGAIEDLSAAVATVAATGPRATSFAGLANLCLTEFRVGRWDDLVSRAYFALSLARDSNASYSVVFFHAFAAMVHACRGQWTAAEARVDGARRAAAAQADLASHAYAALAAAWLAAARGDPQGVLEVLAPLVGDGELDGAREPGIVPWRHLYADALLATGRLWQAAAVIDRLGELASDRALPSAHAAAARARGRLHVLRGDHVVAGDCLQEALDWAKQVPMPFERALTEADLGQLLRRTGNRHQAHLHLTAAHQQLTALRAVPFLPASCCLGQSTTPAALTSQQYAVARLVAGGCTNREAASQLFVSVKTVEYHLGNIYAKFGIHSRSQLASRFRDQDIPPAPQDALQGDAAR
jgi:DNA-binding CsgD family transcriptional regulator